MITKTKVWISRDLDGDSNKEIAFWNQKPIWDQKEHHYECSNEDCDCGSTDNVDCSLVAMMCPTCDNLSNILKAFGVESGTLKRGQLVEFITTATISQGETQEGRAQDLIKRLKSKKKPTQKELIKFLSEMSQTENENEDAVYVQN